MKATASLPRTGIRRNQLAARWGISERTLIRWDADGEGPPGKIKIRNTVLYDCEAADRWWAERMKEAA